jgi:ankyrin repeat protein
MLAEGFKLHNSVLNNDKGAIRKFLNEITHVNITDNGGRTALHLAASYDNNTINVLLPDQALK